MDHYLQISSKPELQDFWTNFKTKLSEIADKVTVNSETTEQMDQLRVKLREGLQNLVTETQNAAKVVDENTGKLQEDIAKITKNTMDIAVETFQGLNNRLQQAATEAHS